MLRESLLEILWSWVRSIPAFLCGVLWLIGDRELHNDSRENLTWLLGCAAGLAIISAFGIAERLAVIREKWPGRKDLARGLLGASIILAALGALFALLIGLAIEWLWRADMEMAWQTAILRAAWHSLGVFSLLTSPTGFGRRAAGGNAGG